MKRLGGALTLIVALGMMSVPGHARTGIPVLAGHNVVVGTGPSAVMVRLNRAAVIDLWEPEWVDWVKSKGTYAGVMIQEITPGYDQTLFYMRLFPPAGCNSAGDCSLIEHYWDRTRSSDTTAPEEMVLVPGTYWVYVFGDPGARVEARLHIPGFEGTTRMETDTAVDARLKTSAPACTAVCYAKEKITGKLRGEGVISTGMWHAPHVSPRQYNQVSCLERGRPQGPNCEPTAFDLGSNQANHYDLSPGTWTYIYNKAELTDRVGAYAFFLTFL